MKSGEINSRSPFHAVTDWIYCPEPLGSPWPAAVGCPGVLGSKSSQLLHGRDFLFYYHFYFFEQEYLSNHIIYKVDIFTMYS